MGKQKERILTEKERQRLVNTNRVTDYKLAEGYKRNDLTVSIVRANIMAGVICIPIVLVFVILFALNAKDNYEKAGYLGELITLLITVVSFIVHELIHGLVWGMCAKMHFKSIEFGFIAQYLTPYCTCLEPLTKAQYVLGTVMPGLVLGIIPLVISVIITSPLLLIYGAVMTLGAGGDYLIIIKLLTYKTNAKDVIFLDHPTECGLIVFEK
ncbi:MAG: DUF3267 domain-containing protein [Clostridia bacterium]|nr:DUF3267 domain-containing protein [Clostridia bacterium]